MSRTMRSQLSLHQCHKKAKSYTSCSLILQIAIIILITQLVNCQRNSENTNNDIEIDPDVFKPNIPAECEDEIICLTDVSYPEERVDRVARDLRDHPVSAVGNSVPNISCQAEFSIWFPKSIRRSKSEPWHRVLHTAEFKQQFRAGQCRRENEVCSNSFQLIGAGEIAVCKQQYSYQQIVVLHPINGTAYATLFPIPSGCSCHK